MLLFQKDFPTVAAQRYEQNEAFFVKLFSDPDMMKMVMDSLGNVVYERLKNKKSNTYQMPMQRVQMVAEDAMEYV